MGFRPLTAEEQAAHENSLRKLSSLVAEPSKVVNTAPTESAPKVDSQVTDGTSEEAAAPVEAAPAPKAPFKKKGG